MTVTDEQIVSAYAESERSRGGPKLADAKECLRATAHKLGVSYERVRDAVLNEWGANG